MSTDTLKRAAELLHRVAVLVHSNEYRACSAMAEKLEAMAEEKNIYVEGWTHDCNALLGAIELWVLRCPHCGKPAPKEPK